MRVAWATLLMLTMAVPAFAQPLVHAGDTLEVDVSNYAAVIDDSQGRLKELSAGTVVVASDGSISIPIAGTLSVAGRSTSEIAKRVERRLEAYVRDPSVTVRLLQQSQTLFLTGATIGTLPYLPGETLSSALGQLREQFDKDFGPALTSGDKNSGALSRSAIDLRRVTLERDKRSGAPIDGEALLRSGAPGPPLAPGDTLLFASKPVSVRVQGQVVTPGIVYVYGDDTLEQALLAAGGPLATASTADATLVRRGVELPLSLGGSALRQAPQNGDVIVVRAAPRVTVLGQVPSPGELVLKNGSSLLSALYLAGGPTKWANVRDVQVIHDGTRRSFDLSSLQHGDLSPDVSLVDGDQVYVPEGHRIDTTLFFQGLVGALSNVANFSHL